MLVIFYVLNVSIYSFWNYLIKGDEEGIILIFSFELCKVDIKIIYLILIYLFWMVVGVVFVINRGVMVVVLLILILRMIWLIIICGIE